MSSSRTPGQRAGLTRAAVVACARDLLVQRGPQALTMRGVAKRLGVAPNALYSHVDTKTALIDEVLDDVLAGVEVPENEDAEPVEGLEATMRSTMQVLSVHPGLVPLYVARQGARGPNAQRLGDVMLALLERAGVTGTDARDAQRVLIVYTIGFAALGLAPPFEPGRPLQPSELSGAFDRGLRWLLEGITTPVHPH